MPGYGRGLPGVQMYGQPGEVSKLRRFEKFI